MGTTGAQPEPEGRNINAAADAILENEYFKLKLDKAVGEITRSQLSFWWKLVGAASVLVVTTLGILGFQVNNERAALLEAATSAKKEAHDTSDQLTQIKFEMQNLVADAKGQVGEAGRFVQDSRNISVQSHSYLLESQNQLSAVISEKAALLSELVQTRDDMMQKLRTESDGIHKTQNEISDELKGFKELSGEVQPHVGELRNVATAIMESRKSGIVELVFLESNQDSTIVVRDPENPQARYNVTFEVGKIHRLFNLDVSSSLDGIDKGTQSFTNLGVGPRTLNISHTPLSFEVDAVRYHRQPFLHSFVILKVFATPIPGSEETNRQAKQSDVSNQAVASMAKPNQ
jgi:hypothetical protein